CRGVLRAPARAGHEVLDDELAFLRGIALDHELDRRDDARLAMARLRETRFEARDVLLEIALLALRRECLGVDGALALFEGFRRALRRRCVRERAAACILGELFEHAALRLLHQRDLR